MRTISLRSAQAKFHTEIEKQKTTAALERADLADKARSVAEKRCTEAENEFAHMRAQQVSERSERAFLRKTRIEYEPLTKLTFSTQFVFAPSSLGAEEVAGKCSAPRDGRLEGKIGRQRRASEQGEGRAERSAPGEGAVPSAHPQAC